MQFAVTRKKVILSIIAVGAIACVMISLGLRIDRQEKDRVFKSRNLLICALQTIHTALNQVEEARDTETQAGVLDAVLVGMDRMAVWMEAFLVVSPVQSYWQADVQWCREITDILRRGGSINGAAVPAFMEDGALSDREIQWLLTMRDTVNALMDAWQGYDQPVEDMAAGLKQLVDDTYRGLAAVSGARGASSNAGY